LGKRFGSCVSFPAVLGHGGVQRAIDIPLSGEEGEALVKNVEEINKMVRAVAGAGSMS
jgi:malate/lactate dehydrogenase